MVGNGPLWPLRRALYFLVVMPRAGPEPVVAHAKSVCGPDRISCSRLGCDKIQVRASLVADLLLKLPHRN